MKKLTFFLLFLGAMAQGYAFNRYWVGGTSGNWNLISSWSDASGGTPGFSVPTATDEVYFDASTGNVSPTVTSNVNITVNSITFTNSNVLFIAPFNQTTIALGVTSGSPTVTLSAANSNIAVGQSVTLAGTNAGTLQANTTVSAISGTTLTLDKTASTTSSAAGTLTFGPYTNYSITATNVTVDGSKITFVDQITITNSLTFQGTDPRITNNAGANGKSVTLGNGNAFTLTGNSTTNYFTGNTNAYYTYNTTSPLTVYFNPTQTTAGGIVVTRGLITLGNNISTYRLNLNQNNNQELIIGENVTLTLDGPTTSYSSSFSSLSNPAGGAVNASAAGSKFLIKNFSTSVLTTSNRIFKENSTINHLQFNKSGSNLVLAQPIRVRTLTKTAGTITNTSPNTITIAPDGTVTGAIVNPVINDPNPLTRYWVGGTTGNWSLATNWGISSGSVNSRGIPEYADDVVVIKDALVTIDQLSTINSLTVAAGGKVTNASTLNASTITLNSNETDGTGTFINNGNTTITNAVVNQYLSSARNWYMSSPVSGASALPDNGGTLAFYSYAESDVLQVTGGNGYGAGSVWNTVSSGSMAVKTGYIVRPSDATSTLSFTGTGLNTGDQTISGITYTAANPKHGFNLIGNPYPSYINVLSAITDNANLEATVWYKTRATNGTYYAETVNATSGVGTNASGTGRVTGYIPPMQAFWVRATASAIDNPQSITLSNANRSHAKTDVEMTGYPSTPTTSLKAPAAKQATYSLLGLNVSNGTNGDEAIVMFTPAATNGIDAYDSGKMTNGNKNIPEIFTLTEGKQLAINGLGSISYDTEIPVGFTTGTAGTFSIKVSQISNFDAGTKVILKDYLDINQPVLTDLSDGSSYSFTSDATSNNTNRFSLLFRAPDVATGVNTASKLNAQVFVNSANQITIIAPEKSNYAIFNAVGQQTTGGTINHLPFSINHSRGVYVVKVNGKSTRVIIK